LVAILISPFYFFRKKSVPKAETEIYYSKMPWWRGAIYFIGGALLFVFILSYLVLKEEIGFNLGMLGWLIIFSILFLLYAKAKKIKLKKKEGTFGFYLVEEFTRDNSLLGTQEVRKKKGIVRKTVEIILIALVLSVAVSWFVRSIVFNAGERAMSELTEISTDKSAQHSEINGNIYRNTKYHFRIKFPENWTIQQGDGPHIVQKAVFGNSTISIIAQEFDFGGESFSSIKDIGSAKEFIDSTIEGTKKKFSDVKVIDYGETKIDNEPAYWVEYSAKSQVLDFDLEATQLIYFLAKGNILYSISAGTASNEYAKIKPKFYQVVSTFVIENY